MVYTQYIPTPELSFLLCLSRGFYTTRKQMDLTKTESAAQSAL